LRDTRLTPLRKVKEKEMTVPYINSGFLFDRETLEQLALEQVCACQYYDLTDYLEITSDKELIDIIKHNYSCELCGMKGAQ
jgi:redox-regulated HSP33 family molecular chaperone